MLYHFSGPYTGLHFPNMGLAQEIHTQPGLPYSASDGFREFSVQQAFVEHQFSTFLFVLHLQLMEQNVPVYPWMRVQMYFQAQGSI